MAQVDWELACSLAACWPEAGSFVGDSGGDSHSDLAASVLALHYLLAADLYRALLCLAEPRVWVAALALASS